MSVQNDNIGDRGAVALAAAVKALFVTTFFVIVRTVCSLGLDLFISCTDDSVPLVCGVGKPCFRVTKELMFCCMCGQHFAHAERFLRNWRSMCCIAVVFSEAACLMSADQRYFSAKTDQIHNAFMHTLYFLRVDNIRINPSKVCAQNWHDGAIRTRVFVGWRFVAIVFFAVTLNMWRASLEASQSPPLKSNWARIKILHFKHDVAFVCRGGAFAPQICSVSVETSKWPKLPKFWMV